MIRSHYCYAQSEAKVRDSSHLGWCEGRDLSQPGGWQGRGHRLGSSGLCWGCGTSQSQELLPWLCLHLTMLEGGLRCRQSYGLPPGIAARFLLALGTLQRHREERSSGCCQVNCSWRGLAAAAASRYPPVCSGRMTGGASPARTGFAPSQRWFPFMSLNTRGE